MEVRTKFEIGDKVYYLSQSGIRENVVIGMEIICHRSRKNICSNEFEGPTRLYFKW